MRRAYLLPVLALAILAGTAIAQETGKPDARASAPPRFATVSAIDREKAIIELTEVQSQIVSETRTRVVTENGKTQRIPATVWQSIYVPVVKKLALDTAEVSSAEGKKLSKEEALKRLTVGNVVLVSADGQPVSPAFRAILAKEAIIIVSPENAKPEAPEANPYAPKGATAAPTIRSDVPPPTVPKRGDIKDMIDPPKVDGPRPRIKK